MGNVPSAIRAREIDPRAVFAIEFHPWMRQYRILNLGTGVAFRVHEHRVIWVQTLAEWQEAQAFAAARKVA